MIHERVGSYRVVSKLGEGGMGVVYIGEHVEIGNRVAIKVLLPELSSHHEAVQRFFNEARAAARIKNPGIVQVYDFGRLDSGSAYFVMELIEGQSLAARLRARHHLPFAEAASITRQIANTLAAAHAQGIVHRDLKPDNVMMVADDEVASGERAKVLDFGIAKLVTDRSVSLKTRTGAVMGTPHYMSPEQSRGSGEVDYRSDIYSLGCILFEMLCGQPPFPGDGLGEILGKHQYVPAPAPSSIMAGIPPALEATVLRTLAKEPAARHGSMVELVRDLEVVTGRPTGAVVARPADTSPPQTGPVSTAAAVTTHSAATGHALSVVAPGRRRSARTWAVVAVLTMGGAVGALFGSGVVGNGGAAPPRATGGSLAAVGQSDPGGALATPPGDAPGAMMAPPADAQRTASGLASSVLGQGNGTAHPKPEDTVTLHYTLWTSDGKLYDTTQGRGKTTLVVGTVFKGWSEGLGLMVVGERRRLWIPAELAYQGQPGRPQGKLVLDVELLAITPRPVPVDPRVASERLDAAIASAQPEAAWLAAFNAAVAEVAPSIGAGFTTRVVISPVLPEAEVRAALARVQRDTVVLWQRGRYTFADSVELAGVEHVALVGPVGTEILVDHGRAVIGVRDSRRVLVRNLYLNHTAQAVVGSTVYNEVEECSRVLGPKLKDSDVLRVAQSAHVTVSNAELEGTGFIGVHATGVTDLELGGSIIHDCVSEAIRLEASEARAHDVLIYKVGNRSYPMRCENYDGTRYVPQQYGDCDVPRTSFLVAVSVDVGSRLAMSHSTVVVPTPLAGGRAFEVAGQLEMDSTVIVHGGSISVPKDATPVIRVTRSCFTSKALPAQAQTDRVLVGQAITFAPPTADLTFDSKLAAGGGCAELGAKLPTTGIRIRVKPGG